MLHQIEAAINHLQHLLDSQIDIETITVQRDRETLVSYQDLNGNLSDVTFYKQERNLIQEILQDVSENPDICIDCMTDDHMDESQYFVHMINAYVKHLVIRYGDSVPISKAMALYFLKYNLSNGFYIFHKLRNSTIIPLNEFTESLCDTDNFMLSLYDVSD